jgi:YfiR/HmsC-like
LSKARLGRKCFSPMYMLMVVIAIVGAPLAQSAQFTVEAVKAAYLFRFAQYVEWPSLAADSPLVIAVSGAEDVAVHLDRLLPGMSVNGHRVVVRRVTTPQELDGVQILYIGVNAFARTRALRAQAVERPILVVTDHKLGLDGGGVINFIEVDRNLRFEISLIAADRSGLKINTQLLSVAARVERRPQGAINCVYGYPTRQRSDVCGSKMANLTLTRGR